VELSLPNQLIKFSKLAPSFRPELLFDLLFGQHSQTETGWSSAKKVLFLKTKVPMI
jgi:hypothetical protein